MELNNDYTRVQQILEENKDKNFVQRILYPSDHKVIDNNDGSVSSHLMSYSEVNGKYIVYPEIVEGQNGELKRLGRKEAVDYALKNKEYIQFDNEKDANWFGKNYKEYWKKTGERPKQE